MFWRTFKNGDQECAEYGVKSGLGEEAMSKINNEKSEKMESLNVEKMETSEERVAETVAEKKVEILEEKEAEASESRKVEVSEGKSSNKSKKIGIIIGSILVILAVGAVSAFLLTANTRSYNSAMEYFENHDYAVAREMFYELGDYSDSAVMVKLCDFNKGMLLFEEGNFTEAASIFRQLGDFENADEMYNKCRFELAMILFDDEDYYGAAIAFEELGDFGNSANMLLRCIYYIALQKYIAENFEESAKLFAELGNYENSKELANRSSYTLALRLFDEGRYNEAYEMFVALGNFRNSELLAEISFTEESVDGQFMLALGRGLMARWEQVVADLATFTPLTANMLNRYIDFELEQIEVFYEMPFGNESLQEDARDYIETLRASREATADFDPYSQAFHDRWEGYFSHRGTLLSRFVAEHGLTVDSDFQIHLDDFMDTPEEASQRASIRTSVRSMLTRFNATSVSQELGFNTHTVSVTNTTDRTFDRFAVRIIFLDDGGNVVRTAWSIEVENWEPGEEIALDFWTSENIDVSDYTIELSARYKTGIFFE